MGNRDGQHHRARRADGVSASFRARARHLFLWHLLGLFGTDPGKLHRMFLILQSFMPPDPKVQDILDSAMASVVVTGSSGLLANAGIILGIYFGTVFIATISRAFSQMHGVQEDRHWWSKYIISFFMLFWFGIVILFCFNAVVFGEKLAGIAEVNLQLSFPLQAWIARLNLPLTGVALLVLALALYLLTPENYLTDSPGVAGRSFLCGRLDHCDQTFPVLCGAIRSV